MPKISVIVPVYNVEEYLEQCLESIIGQTYKNIEIICVNDGSTDKSSLILNKFACKDNRIKIINQPNQGLSAARNTGIKHATGEYISFIDSDDFVSTTLYETLAEYLPAEIICFNAEAFGDIQIPQTIQNNLKCHFKGENEITDKIILKTNVYAWNKLYKTEIIKKYNIEFPYGLYFEDFVFLWDYMLKIKKAYYLNTGNYYFYRQRQNSIMNNCSGKSIHHLYAWHNLYKRLQKQNILAQHKHSIIKLFEIYFRLAYKLSDEAHRELIIKTARKYADEIKYKKFNTLKESIIHNTKMNSNVFQKLFLLRNEGNNKNLNILGLKFSTKRIIKFNPKPRILVHLHLYYHAQLDYMLKKLGNINNCDWDLFVTVSEENPAIINRIKAFKPDAQIIKVKNTGYDIWPFIYVLNLVDLKNYDYILKIHTKNYRKEKAWEFGKGFTWRNLLIDALLGSKLIFNNNLYQLNLHPKIGMIASLSTLSQMGDKYAEDNRLFSEMCSKYRIPAQKGIFVAGTMFIARANCFAKIKEMNLTESDFPEKQETSGRETIAHTLERMFSRIIEAQNYKILGIKNKKYIMKKEFKKFSQELFSVKNSNDNEIKSKKITILGLKFYFAKSK